MTRIGVEVERSRSVPADLDSVWAVVGDVERHGELMPRVETFEEVDRGWHWVMEEVRRFGQRLQPRFTVDYTLDELREVRFEKVEQSGDSADASGVISLREDGDGAVEVTFRIDIGLDAGIPSMLSGAARSMLASEVEDLVAGFLDSVEAATAS
jgi:carbon monoxide dehydrogenase subunit G